MLKRHALNVTNQRCQRHDLGIRARSVTSAGGESRGATEVGQPAGVIKKMAVDRKFQAVAMPEGELLFRGGP